MMTNSKRIKIIVLLMLQICLGSQAQSLITKAFEEGLKVRQIPGSNEKLKEYFSAFADNDTVNAIIFPPANCPRCEGLIEPIIEGLKETRPDIPAILVAVYPDPKAAKTYLDRYNLTADTIIFDVADRYREIFSFDIGFLHIPYLIKVSPTSGDLIVGVRAEDNSDGMLKEFCSFDKPMEKEIFDIGVEHEQIFRAPNVYLESKHQYQMTVPNTVTLSEIQQQSEFYKDKLFFNDKLNEEIEYFQLTEKDSGELEFKASIRTDSAQNKTFVAIPDEDYERMLMENSVRFIPLAPKMVDDHTLAVSYSLPRLWQPGPNRIAYMNKSAYLLVNTDSIGKNELLPFRYELKDYFYPHFNIFLYGNDIAMGCKRITWPIEIDKEDYCNIPEFNPFSEEFYTYPQPIVVTFDKESGELKDHVGQLPSLSEITRTGSYFVAPVIDTWNNEIAMSDGFSGEIEVFTYGDSVKTKFHAYEIPMEYVPQPDSTNFYSFDCVAPYKGVFNRKIIDVKVTPEKIYCLVRYKTDNGMKSNLDQYSVIRIDRDCDCATEKSFAQDPNSIRYYGLRRTDDGVEPYAICKEGDEWKVVTYTF